MDFLQFYQLGSSNKNPETPYSSDQSWLMGKILLLIVILDFIYLLAVDNLLHEPLFVLVIFVCQILGFIISLILYIMGAANQAMQTGLLKVHHHETALLSLVLYIILCIWWYVWTLRRSWPSISEQFSFSFLSNPVNQTGDIGQSSWGYLGYGISTPKSEEDLSGRREFYTLWSPGYMALYICLRTVGCLWYLLFLKSAFMMFNSSLLKESEEDGNQNRVGGNKLAIKTIDSERMSHQGRERKCDETGDNESDGSFEEEDDDDEVNYTGGIRPSFVGTFHRGGGDAPQFKMTSPSRVTSFAPQNAYTPPVKLRETVPGPAKVRTISSSGVVGDSLARAKGSSEDSLSILSSPDLEGGTRNHRHKSTEGWGRSSRANGHKLRGEGENSEDIPSQDRHQRY